MVSAGFCSFVDAFVEVQADARARLHSRVLQRVDVTSPVAAAPGPAAPLPAHVVNNSCPRSLPRVNSTCHRLVHGTRHPLLPPAAAPHTCVAPLSSGP